MSFFSFVSFPFLSMYFPCLFFFFFFVLCRSVLCFLSCFQILSCSPFLSLFVSLFFPFFLSFSLSLFLSFFLSLFLSFFLYFFISLFLSFFLSFFSSPSLCAFFFWVPGFSALPGPRDGAGDARRDHGLGAGEVRALLLHVRPEATRQKEAGHMGTWDTSS